MPRARVGDTANPRMCVYGVFCVVAGRAENGVNSQNVGIVVGISENATSINKVIS